MFRNPPRTVKLEHVQNVVFAVGDRSLSGLLLDPDGFRGPLVEEEAKLLGGDHERCFVRRLRLISDQFRRLVALRNGGVANRQNLH